MFKISIIVPIFNSDKYLDKCLTSLQTQTISNIEIIMIDDGSTDCSFEICKKYCDTDKRFLYYYQENQGQSIARNNGLQRACGDLVGFCDSDDWVSPDYYERLSRPFKDPLCDCSICGYQISDGIRTSNHILPEKDEVIEVEELAHRFLLYTQNSMLNSVCNKLFRRDRIMNVFPSDMTCGEDLFFCMNYLATAKSIAIVRSDGYFYFNSPTTAVKYKLNNARQCDKYSKCVLPFLNNSVSEQETKRIYEIFSCGNIGRDVAMIAKALPRMQAVEMIREFYDISSLRRAIYSDAWRELGKKYRVIGTLLKRGNVEAIVLTTKLLAKRM